VPDGFTITTQAYRSFVTSNGLDNKILAAIETTPKDNPDALVRVSKEIRSWFLEGLIPAELTVQVVDAYGKLERVPVAVRSSATAEDLPELSFAGQQDTFLNVIGNAALLEAVVRCWSSLWTARAIGYRTRNAISHTDVALAVIVQEMVPAEASGVLFSANPLNGRRGETVIDATLGLGEALVSGQVDPDHYVVDTGTRKIISKSVGAKALVIRGAEGGGVTGHAVEAKDTQAIQDEVILDLVDMGQRVTRLYEFPQDIEWAWADGELYLLQSRPITALFPVPQGMKADPLKVMLSFGAIQGILEPMSPLGQDTIRLLFAGGADLLGYSLTHKTLGVLKTAGERLWVDITPLLRNSVGRAVIPRFLSLIDPAILQALENLIDDPRLRDKSGPPRLRSMRRVGKLMRPMIKGILKNLPQPDDKAEVIQQKSRSEIERIDAISDLIEPDTLGLTQRMTLYKEMRGAFPFALPKIFTGAFAGILPLFMLNRIANHLTGSGDLALEVTRGLPNNVTTEMDLALWETAGTLRADPASFRRMEYSSPGELAYEYLRGGLPQVAQEAINQFLERYGMRGPGEIDIGRPRWREDPTHILQVLKNYLQIEDQSMAPDVVFRRGEDAAQTAIEQLAGLARQTRGGWLKVRFVHWAARRVRALAGLRESPKFHIIQMMGIIRQSLLEGGGILVELGILENADDIFFLYIDELETLAADLEADKLTNIEAQKALIHTRRETNARELRRAQIPRLLLSDGQTFYEGISAGEGKDGITGSPVSPGVVEGYVRVVLEPHSAHLSAGEILVCPATDPAWTPLFLSASGLVMEVGGMMTHGSVVAREYGIPAVVGVHQATERLRTGMRIRLDGSSGLIQIIEIEP
jgi:pyruvate,water dikinase